MVTVTFCWTVIVRFSKWICASARKGTHTHTHTHISKKKQLNPCIEPLRNIQIPGNYIITTMSPTSRKLAASSSPTSTSRSCLSLINMYMQLFPHLPPALFWSWNSEAGSMMSNWMGVPGAIRSSGSGAAPVFWEPPLVTCTPPGFALQERDRQTEDEL